MKRCPTLHQRANWQPLEWWGGVDSSRAVLGIALSCWIRWPFLQSSGIFHNSTYLLYSVNLSLAGSFPKMRSVASSMMSFINSEVNSSLSIENPWILSGKVSSFLDNGPGMILTLMEGPWEADVCLDDILIGKRVHIESSMGKEISVIAWRTELFPVFWSPTMTSYWN